MSVCAAPTCSHQSFDGSSYYVDVDELKSELARASMTTSDVNNQWRSNFQQQII